MASLAEKLKNGQTIVTAWSGLAVPILSELLARSGYEAVTMDLQHGQHDLASARDAFAAMSGLNAHRIARIPVGDFATASRLLDLGAEAIIAPMINSAKEAQAFADFMKFPPMGRRSWSPHRAAMLAGQDVETYFQRANQDLLALAMIETKEAIEALDDILAVDGIDGVFVGPSDLSLTLSNGAALEPNSPATAKIAAEIASRAREAGKIASIFCLTAEKVHESREAGFQLMAYGMDMGLFSQAATDALKACKP
ncbi:4-hydroxy-2-oxoheptanedioate aldolase [Roseibium hamelinense]|uniref:4-hydroxy-2-oxoheptanedioate aldolase n=1 Tax=Roseibium hamelinense TaxID=150831 RepID=A0A562T9W5_9HYPH|nr:aldolase/citrate lyase family protein [Roseibium hamelinense]MTI45168.1 hydroxyacid aldolase [Roseibium hamelinense]TWI90471.1 4-hydroxy-2-oxoheptanedioate aldolase [Roseibium hamelinense]